jgi:hypothetical protein
VKIASKLASVAIASTVGVLAYGGAALADPSTMFEPVPPHRHFLVQPDGTRVPIGPQVCENPDLAPAFAQFHYNIHHSHLPGIGVVDTLGPQDGAPGLHNSLGADMTATLC